MKVRDEKSRGKVISSAGSIGDQSQGFKYSGGLKEKKNVRSLCCLKCACKGHEQLHCPMSSEKDIKLFVPANLAHARGRTADELFNTHTHSQEIRA